VLLCVKFADPMFHKTLSILFFLLPHFILSGNVHAQDWEFAKEKDGIKIYTRKTNGSNLKSFKGTMDVHSTMDKVTNLVGNVKNHDWWDKNISEIKVLYFEKDKHFQYYLVYDVPWPLSDRDLVVDATVTIDPVTGKRVISAKPLLNTIPEKPDVVRITNYSQTWTIIPMANGIIRLNLEGCLDPGGNVPTWLINMVITDTPLKVMRGIKEKVDFK
jgi:hypothetical protein